MFKRSAALAERHGGQGCSRRPSDWFRLSGLGSARGRDLFHSFGFVYWRPAGESHATERVRGGSVAGSSGPRFPGCTVGHSSPVSWDSGQERCSTASVVLHMSISSRAEMLRLRSGAMQHSHPQARSGCACELGETVNRCSQPASAAAATDGAVDWSPGEPASGNRGRAAGSARAAAPARPCTPGGSVRPPPRNAHTRGH